MPTTRFRSAGPDGAANFEEVETYATSGSSEVHELRDQLSVLTDLVAQQAVTALAYGGSGHVPDRLPLRPEHDSNGLINHVRDS